MSNVVTGLASALANNATTPFSKLGIRLSYLDYFIANACGGSQAIEGKTTTEVCETIVKRATLLSQSSYCDLLQSLGDPAVGNAVVFISHAWKYEFLQVVNALKSHFKLQPDIIIWFDLFSNNQHKAVSLDFQWWCGVFMSAISDFRHVVMVLSPWNDPVTLTRAWCLFEAYCSAKTNCKFEVVMGVEQTRSFFDAIVDNATKHIDNMLAKIDSEKSECFKPEDKEKIFEVVRQEVGFETINSMIFEQLRGWVIAVTKEELDASKKVLANEHYSLAISYSPTDIASALTTTTETTTETTTTDSSLPAVVSQNTTRYMKLERALAELYEGQGLYAEAEASYSRCLEAKKVYLGLDDASTLQAEHDLAEIYRLQGKYSNSESLHVHCLERRNKVLGEDDEETLRSLHCLGILYHEEGDLLKAEEIKLRCFGVRKNKLGEDHLDTLKSMNGLAILYMDQEQYDEAKTLYARCLELRKAKLGDDHPETVDSMNNLAVLYFYQGHYDDAEPLYTKCLELRRTMYGESHPSTLDSMANLGELFMKQGKYAEAEPLCVKSLDLSLSSLGDDHPSTLDSMNTLASLFSSLGRHDDAEVLMNKCIDLGVLKLGGSHPDIIKYKENLACITKKKICHPTVDNKNENGDDNDDDNDDVADASTSTSTLT